MEARGRQFLTELLDGYEKETLGSCRELDEEIPGHQRRSFGNGTPASNHGEEKPSLMARERVVGGREKSCT